MAVLIYRDSDNSGTFEQFEFVNTYANIADAVAASQAGDKLLIQNGTYTLTSTLEIGKRLIIEGQSQSGVQINGAGLESYGFHVTADGVTMSNFTLTGPKVAGASTNDNYGIKVEPDTTVRTDTVQDFALSNVTIQGSLRSELDLNGVNGASLTNVTLNGQNSAGVGLAITDSANVTITNLATSGNAWGSVALYNNNTYYDQAIANIVFAGSYTSAGGAGEPVGIYSEKSGPNAQPIGSVTFPANFSADGDGTWTVTNDTYRGANSGNFTFYFGNEADAVAFAKTLNGSTNDDSVVRAPDGTIHVSEGLSIQEAIDQATAGATIVVHAGDYNLSTALNIDKSLNFVGANAGLEGKSNARAAETVLVGSSSGNMINLADRALTVSFDGFKLTGDSVMAEGTQGQVFSMTNSKLEITATKANVFYMGYAGGYDFTFSSNMVTATGYTEFFDLFEKGKATIEKNVFTGIEGAYVAGKDNDVPLIVNLGVEGTVKGNIFQGVDIGVLVADNAGPATISENIFTNLHRDGAETAGGLAAGIVLFSPNPYAGTITIERNVFSDADAGIRTSKVPNETTTLDGSNIRIDGNSFSNVGEAFRDTIDGGFIATNSTINNVLVAFTSTSNGDTFASNAGNDRAVGGEGTDTASYTGTLTAANIAFDTLAGTWTVTSQNQGTDTLTGFERVTDGTNTFLLVGAGGFATLQAAIDAASAGDTILVASGSYAGNVTVDEAVTILGANSGKAGTASRGAESRIVGQITVSANATIDGVEIRNTTENGLGTDPARQFEGVRVKGAVDVTVTNSIFHSTGPNGVDNRNGVTNEDKAIYLDTSAVGKITITNNLFGGDQQGANDKFGTANWARAIWSDGAADKLTVTGNTFDNVRTGLNLDGYVDAKSEISGNTFRDSGTGMTFGASADPSKAAIANNSFINTNTDISLQNLGVGQTIDLTASNNLGSGGDSDATMTVLGSSAGDVLRGGLNGDVLYGNAGDDVLEGRGSSDVLFGGAGIDTARFDSEVTLSAVADSDPFTPGDQPAWVARVNAADVDTLSGIEIVDAGGVRTLLVGNGGFATIQAALNVAQANDRILVAAGTYNESFTINKAVTLVGANEFRAGASLDRVSETIINGQITVVADATIQGVQMLNDVAAPAGWRSIQVQGAVDVTIVNSVFFSNGPVGNGGDWAILLDTRATGKVNIAGNFFTGSQQGVEDKFSGSNWDRAIWSDGRHASLSISSNTFDNVRTGMNLNEFNNLTTSVVSNTFRDAGSGITLGGPTTSTEVTGIAGNTFTNVNTDFNLQNIATGLVFDLDATANVGGGSGADAVVLVLGTAGGDALTGTDGNDALSGMLGNDAIDGGDGTDTAVLTGSWKDYAITQAADGTFTLTGPSGTDTVKNVETFSFNGTLLSADVILNDAPEALDDDLGYTGDALANDTDVDIVIGDALKVADVTGASGTATPVGINTVVDGTYGTLTISSTGGYSYAYDASRAASVALAGGQTAVESFGYTVSDLKGRTDTAAITFSVTGTNDQPTDGSESVSVTEGATAEGSVLTNTVDPDTNDRPFVSAVEGGTVGTAIAGQYGSVTINADGTYSYVTGNRLADGAKGTDSFSYTVSDGKGGSVTSVLAIEVTGANAVATIGGTASGNVTEDDAQAAQGTLFVSDADDGQSLFRAESGTTSHGSWAITADGAWTFVLDSTNPAVQALGLTDSLTDTFVVTSSDGSATREVSVLIAGANDRPTVATADANGAVTEDASSPDLSAAGSFGFDDVDLTDTHSVSVASASSSPLGTLTAVISTAATGAAAGEVSWTYTLSNAAAQTLSQQDVVTETFTVTVTDANGLSVDKTVSVTITGTDDLTVTTAEGQNLGSVTETAGIGRVTPADRAADGKLEPVENNEAAIGQLIAGNPDDMPAVLAAVQSSYALTKAEAIATVWNYLDDNYSYYNTPVNEASARLGVEYALYLKDGGTPLVSTTAKYAADGGDAGTTPDRQQTLHDNLLGNLHGPSLVDKLLGPGQGSNPNPGQDSYDQIIALLADKGLSNLATDRAYYGGYENEANNARAFDQANGLLPAAVSGKLDATDVDAGRQISWSGSATGTYGSFVIATDGSWTYNLNNLDADTQALAAGETAEDVFTATVSDGQGGTKTEQVTITVTGTNDPAVLSAGVASLTESNETLSASGTLSIDDVDGAEAFVAQENTAGTYGTFSISETGAWSYVTNGANDQFVVGQTYAESFVVKAADGTETKVAISILGTNDAAVLTSAIVNLTETNSVLTASGTLVNTDVDSAQTFVPQTSTGTYGVFSIDEDGAWSYFSKTANDELNGGRSYSEVFAVTAADGTQTSVTVNIAGTNDVATVNYTGTPVVFEDGTLTDGHQFFVDDADLGENGIRPESGTLTYGSYVINADGTYSYTLANGSAAVQQLAGGQRVTETFTGTSLDGTGTKSVEVTIWGANDQVTLGTGSVTSGTVAEDSGATLTATGSIAFADVDRLDTHFAIVQASSSNTLGGTLVASVTDDSTGDGTGSAGWTYTLDNAAAQKLAAGQSVTETFTVSVYDNTSGRLDQTVTVTVTGTNDVPTIAAGVNTGTITEKEDSYGKEYDLPAVSGYVLAGDVDADAVVRGEIVGASATISNNPTSSANSYTAAKAALTANSNLTLASVTTEGGTKQLGWTYNPGNVNLDFLNAGDSLTVTYTVKVVDDKGVASGQTQDIVITINGANEVQNGVEGEDSPLTGGAANDTITGNTGDDSISGASGADTLAGGSGDDVISGGSGADSLAGGDGDDMLNGGSDNDTLDGGAGSDTIEGGSGTDTVLYGAWSNYDLTRTSKVTFVEDRTTGDVDTLTGVEFLSFNGTSVTIAQAVNDAPIGVNDAASVVEAGATVAGTPGAQSNVLGNDTDADSTLGLGETKLVSAVRTGAESGSGTPGTVGTALAGTYGSLTLSADGSYTYTLSDDAEAVQALKAGQLVSDVFTYTVVDAHGATDTAQLVVTVTGSNDAPVVAAAIVDQAGSEGQPFSFTVPAGSFTDAETATLSYSATLESGSPLPAWLNFNAATRTFSGTPGATDGGDYDIRVTASDGSASTSDVFRIAIGATNAAPTGTPTAVLASGTEDTAYVVSAADLLEGLADPDGDTLSIGTLSASSGVVTANGDGSYTVSAPANANGPVTLNYTVIDGNGGSVAATQSFTRVAVNDGPTGSATAVLADGTEDTAYVVSAADLLAGFSDVDGPALSVANLVASSGTVTANGNGTYTVSAPANASGAVTLSYDVTDGTLSTAATQTFTRVAVNDAPTGKATAMLADGAEDTAYVVSAADLLQGFSDVDGPALSVANLVASSGTVTANGDGTYTVSAPANANGPVTLSYDVTDGTLSVAATQSFTRVAVNDGPTGSATAILADGTEDTAYVVSAADLLKGFSDVDGPALSVANLVASSGTVTANGDGSYTVSAPANASGPVTLSYDVTDGTLSVAATQTFTRVAVNDGPTGSATAALPAGTEDVAYTVSKAQLLQGFADADGDTLNVANLAASSGTIADNGDGTYTISQAVNVNGPVTLSYVVEDGNGGSTAATLGYTLAAVNDVPTGTATATLAPGSEDSAYVVSETDLLAGFSDVDGNPLSVTNLTASNGFVFSNGDGTYTIAPTGNFNGTVTLSYGVTDGIATTPATQQYVVAAVNDAPMLVAALADQSAQQGAAFTYTVPANSFIDVDNATLTYSATLANGDALPGWLSFNAATRTFAGTPAGSDVGSVEVRVTASDGSLSANDVFVVAITAVNAAPTITSNGGGAAAGISVLEGTTAVTDVDATDSDGPNALVYSIVGGADAAKFTINAATGVLSFVSAPAWAMPTDVGTNNVYDVVVRASDGAAFDDQALAVTVNRATQNVTVTLTNAADTFTAQFGDNFTVEALGGADTVTTLGGNDTVRGGAGNDTISTGAGNDVITYLGTGDGTDTVNGGDGFDTIRAIGANTSISWGNFTNVEAIDGAGFGNVRIVGTTGADAVDLSGYQVSGIAMIDTGAGADTVTGSAGADTINAGAGRDEVKAGGGDDVILMGFSLDGDTIDGGSGTDTVRATAANIGILYSAISNVEVFDAAGLANVRLSGTSGADIMDLSGKTLLGGMQINGGDGNDTVIGSAADDVIIGSTGADTLTGGAGADTFRFVLTSDSRGAVRDTITDFTTGADKIDFSAIDADGSTANGDQAFTFIGTASFSGVAGQARYEIVNGTTYVYTDINGDKSADMAVILTGVHNLAGTDFLL